MPLATFTLFDTLLMRTRVNERRAEVLNVLDALTATYTRLIYASCQYYGNCELRAQQGYLRRFPAALAALLSDTAGTTIGG